MKSSAGLHSNVDYKYYDTAENAPAHVVTMLSALQEFIGAKQMIAYLVMMTARLIELHPVLEPTESIYLHCDATACGTLPAERLE